MCSLCFFTQSLTLEVSPEAAGKQSCRGAVDWLWAQLCHRGCCDPVSVTGPHPSRGSLQQHSCPGSVVMHPAEQHRSTGPPPSIPASATGSSGRSWVQRGLVREAANGLKSGQRSNGGRLTLSPGNPHRVGFASTSLPLSSRPRAREWTLCGASST